MKGFAEGDPLRQPGLAQLDHCAQEAGDQLRALLLTGATLQVAQE